MTNRYFGKDCPKGMVQVEFVGCNPSKRIDDYSWKPCESAFLEVYVDGQRFRIDVGTFDSGNGKRRGLHIIGPLDLGVEHHSSNALDVYIKPTSEQEQGQ